MAKEILGIDNNIQDTRVNNLSDKLKCNKLYQKNQHVFKYAVIGVSGVLIDYLVFIFLTQKLKFNYQIANAISVSLGITNNFLLNYFFNFRSRGFLLKGWQDFILLAFSDFY